MDNIDNETTLQGLIDAQYALLTEEQTLYADLQAQKAALIAAATAANPGDAASLSRGGPGGSESYAYQTVTQQLTDCAKRLADLSANLKSLWEMKNARFPWISGPGAPGNCY